MTESPEKQILRRNFLYKYTKQSLYGYGITISMLFFAKWFGIASFTYDKLIFDFVWILASVGLFVLWIRGQKQISAPASNVITILEFINWLAIFWYTIFFLDEIRMVSLFFSIIVLVFMLSHSNFITSIAITVFFAITYTIISYICINFLGQKGVFSEQLFYVIIFVPTGFYISWMSEAYRRQLHKARASEKATESARSELQKIFNELRANEIEIENKNSALQTKQIEIERINISLNEANNEVYRKNIELTDSINYARYIQKAIVPGQQIIKQNFPDSFVFLKPKDIVSGDFCWTWQKDNFACIVAADCTGHGVPGAMLSMIGVSLLNEIVNVNNALRPNFILEILKMRLINLFRYEKNGAFKDGIELALCCVDFSTNKLYFSGSNNPLYLISDGKLRIVKADPMPIGNHTYTINKEFTKHVIDIKSGDSFYIFSDGFADQFGGPKGKKYLYKRMQELFVQHHHLPAEEQRKKIIQEFYEWKGKEEQVDDVLVIGVRLQ
ncbi:MAG: SpoIIE family protein phosphatase [Bacteroidetes bacterium]|nr:SpoIIE family protein phosphatase [Bacteroidota bacterium]